MTLRTEAGHIQVLKYILEVTAEHDEKGMFSDESGTAQMRNTRVASN